MKRLFVPLIDFLHGKNPGVVGAMAGFGFGLLLVIFGFWRTLLVLGLTVLGYVVGVHFFKHTEIFETWLNRLLPPGRFR